MMNGTNWLSDDYLHRVMRYEQLLSRRLGVFLREVRPGIFAWRCVAGHTHYSEMRLTSLPNGEFRLTMKDLPKDWTEPQETVSEEKEERTTSLELALDERIEQLLREL